MKFPAYPRTKPSGVAWLGEIAHDWTVSPIKHLVSTPVTDGPHETPEIFDEGIPFVSAEAVSGGRINFEKIRGHITAEDHKRFSRKYKPRRGDIYLIKSGATTGRVAMVETDIEFNIWSPLAAIRCEPKNADRQFLFFYMQSKEFQTAIELSWSFGTQQNIGMGVIQNLAVPLPSLPEQRGIAAFLDRETGWVDRLVAEKRELIERLKEKRTALISRTVTRGLPPAAARAAGLPANPPLKPSGIGWLGDIPKHWRVMALKWRSRCRSGDSIATEDVTPEPTPERSIPVIGGNGVMGYCDSSNSNHPVLVIGRVGALCGNVHLITPPAWITDNALVMPTDAATFSQEYLAAVLRTRNLNELADKTAQPLITGTRVRNERIPVPPLPEQAAIAAYLDEETAKLDALVGKVEEAVERLQEYRIALITAAVTGKIDVRNDAPKT